MYSVWLNILDTQTDACCLYNNTNNLDSIKRYGALYNWDAVNKMNFAPIGWHVLSDTEWEILDKFLTENNASYFDTNGFSATLGGCRYFSGEFINLGDCARWWSYTERNEQQAYCHLLYNNGKDVDDFTDKSAGLSVRLIKD